MLRGKAGEIRIPCPENLKEFCPNPREDEHHRWPRRTADTPTKKRFGNLACNKIISCRCIHEQILDRLPPPEYPPIDEMKRVIAEARNGTNVNNENTPMGLRNESTDNL